MIGSLIRLLEGELTSMGALWETVIIFACITGVLCTIGYMVTTSLLQWREEKRRLKYLKEPQIYEMDSRRHPSKSFVGPDGKNYRPDYDADLVQDIPNVILASVPLMDNVIAGVSMLTAVGSDDGPSSDPKETESSSSSSYEASGSCGSSSSDSDSSSSD